MVGIWGIGFGISIWRSKCKERVFLDICQSGKTCGEWISKQAAELMEKFEKGYFKTIYDIMIHQFQFQEYICAGIGECNLERRILIANNIRRMNTEKWIIGFILSMCFILFGGISVVTAMESMQLGYRILDRNTTEEIVVDGTPEVMNLVVHKRYGYDPRIFHTKYLEDDGSIYGVDFLKKKERVQTKWIYLKKGQKVFFKVFDMTDKDANKRKLEAGIRDFSNNIKYVNRSEEIDYKFSIEKSGKYQKLHDRDNNEFEISRIKYLQSSDAIYNIDKIEAKERLETKWIYLRKGQKVFFQMYAYDTTNKSTKNRKLHAGIIDYSKHIKYVENNEEIAYIFKIPKNGKYRCYVYNCSDF